MTDQIQRFTFANLPIRGEIISLQNSFQQICEQHNYSPLVRHLMGEALAATALMTEIIKIDGKIALQLQSPAFLKLLLTECNHQGQLRGVMHTNDQISAKSDYQFDDWTQGGQMAITIEPEKGHRYQGVVSLDKNTLGECLQDYFTMSEQLPTYIKLFVSDDKVTGLFLQALPQSEDSPTTREQAFEHVTALAETLKTDEALELEHQDILYRLFHQDEVTLFPPKALEFQCSCSRERNEQALLTVQASELMSLVKEQNGQIEMVCDFCNKQEVFTEQHIIDLITNSPSSEQVN
ncbi:MAG: Hsp33 family molecular chaperone HslO [Kangiellaceae bacterium]|nr:Hsp33 family molecular chaperone HslO [Kangiellaceae bacterium]